MSCYDNFKDNNFNQNHIKSEDFMMICDKKLIHTFTILLRLLQKLIKIVSFL
jgi:hypothetical protein